MTCDNCKKPCWNAYYAFLCNDGCRVIICEPCKDSWAALERMLKTKHQQFILPPDGVSVLALVSEHEGVNVKISKLPF